MATNIKKKLHYRHAGFAVPTSLTLEAMLRAALLTCPTSNHRVRPLGAEVFQVLNSTGTIKNALCGVVHRWIEGQNQLVFDRDASAAVWEIREVAPPPPSKPHHKRNFLPFTLYFGVRDNHVIVVQSLAMQSSELAEYLTWLVTSTGAAGHAGQFVSLYPASAQLLRKKGVHKAKAVRIEMPLADLVERTPPAASRKKKTFWEKVVNPARAKVFTNALNTLGVPAPASILSSPEAKDLKVTLEVERPFGREPLGNGAMNLLGQLVASQTSEHYSVVMQDNSVLKGGDLKLSRDFEIVIPDGATHPRPADVFGKIDQYLQDLITSNSV